MPSSGSGRLCQRLRLSGVSSAAAAKGTIDGGYRRARSPPSARFAWMVVERAPGEGGPARCLHCGTPALAAAILRPFAERCEVHLCFDKIHHSSPYHPQLAACAILAWAVLRLNGPEVLQFIRIRRGIDMDEKGNLTVQRLALWGIPLSLGVMGLKMVAWWVTGSVALLSDGLESIGQRRCRLHCLLRHPLCAEAGRSRSSLRPPQGGISFGRHRGRADRRRGAADRQRGDRSSGRAAHARCAGARPCDQFRGRRHQCRLGAAADPDGRGSIARRR